MADNYLEKRMEDYRKGVLKQSKPTKVTPTGKKPGEVTFNILADKVFVALSDEQLQNVIVQRLANLGCKVAFCSTDAPSATRLAQSCGAMACPVKELTPESAAKMAAIAATRWKHLDVAITDLPRIPSVSHLIKIDRQPLSPTAPNDSAYTPNITAANTPCGAAANAPCKTAVCTSTKSAVPTSKNAPVCAQNSAQNIAENLADMVAFILAHSNMAFLTMLMAKFNDTTTEQNVNLTCFNFETI